MAEFKYLVVRSFRYGEKFYHRGDEWTPGGFRLDNQLMKTHVKIVPVETEMEAKANGKQKRSTRKAV